MNESYAFPLKPVIKLLGKVYMVFCEVLKE